MKVTNMTAGTLVRTVMLVVALLNLVLTSFGKNPLPFSDEQIYTGLSAPPLTPAVLCMQIGPPRGGCCAQAGMFPVWTNDYLPFFRYRIKAQKSSPYGLLQVVEKARSGKQTRAGF